MFPGSELSDPSVLTPFLGESNALQENVQILLLTRQHKYTLYVKAHFL